MKDKNRVSVSAELQQLQKLLANYEELLVNMVDDDAYVARGNGFCDAKYSEDFLQGQIEAIKGQIEATQEQIEAMK